MKQKPFARPLFLEREPLEAPKSSQWKTARKLLEDAVAAYRFAVEVYTKADLPQYWAGTQCNLSDAIEAWAISWKERRA